MRSGTLNVTGIVGFAKALELSMDEMASEGERLTGLRQRLFERLTSDLDYIFLNVHKQFKIKYYILIGKFRSLWLMIKLQLECFILLIMVMK